MARGFRGRKSFYNAGGPTSGSETEWTPRVDKNPFYRTMDIFNGVFKKNIKLSAGKSNCTDLHTIFINFGELKPSRLESLIRPGKDAGHAVFMLACGHEWEGKTTNAKGLVKVIGTDWGMCGICGADQIYRGFEHEWQHIIFKSDLAARKIFVEQYADQLHKQAPQIDRDEITGFLHLLVNAFDDLRVNSLWEKVYPGSALAIWDRWRWYVSQMEDAVNTSFLAYIFAVAFGMPTDPNGEFEAMRPVIEWAAKKVKYRGFGNMLIDVRVVIDRCMGALLARIPPPAPKGLQPPPPPSLKPPPQQLPPAQAGAGNQDGTTNSDQGNTNGKKDTGEKEEGQDQGQSQTGSTASDQSHSTSSSDPQTDGSRQEGASNEEVEEDSSQGGGQQGGQIGNSGSRSQAGGGSVRQGAVLGLGDIPSAKDIQADEKEREAAIRKLIADPVKLDPKEEHSDATPEDAAAAQGSQATRAMVAKVLNQDLSDLNALEAKMPEEPDPEMQQQIDQLQNGVASKSESSQLTGNAKARITIIDVTKDGVGKELVELDAEERFYVQRMRSAFFRSMGRQKAKRAPSGTVVDVQSLIQYRGDHQDPNVFENEDVNQGFAYSVLCDMSGSMSGTFPVVCHAVEMLKQALHFPFVVGSLWGFRGGERITGKTDNFGEGEVWMYRYAKDVNWYTGITPFRLHNGFNGTTQVKVECGGITPMNSAINVTSAHLWRKMPTGMAKRMFLLTDGSPIQTKVSGQQIPEFLLRQFVAKEIRDARKHGIQVYTIIIGEHSIDEERCLQMFGPRKFWRRVGQQQVGSTLANLVLANFSKYIKARG